MHLALWTLSGGENVMRLSLIVGFIGVGFLMSAAGLMAQEQAKKAASELGEVGAARMRGGWNGPGGGGIGGGGDLSYQLDRIERKIDKLTRLLEDEPGFGHQVREVESRVDMQCMSSVLDSFSRFDDKLQAAKTCRTPGESLLVGCRLVESLHDQNCVSRVVDSFTRSDGRAQAVEACRIHKYVCEY